MAGSPTRNNARSPRTRRLVVALLLAFALLLPAACGPAVKGAEQVLQYGNRGSSMPQPGQSVVPQPAGVVKPPAQGAYGGIYQPPAPFDISALSAYSAITDKPPAIVMWYQPWSKSGPREFDPAAVVSIYEQGAVPMITWEPWNPGKDANLLKDPSNQPVYKLSNIIRGDFDPYIHSFARAVKSVRGPVMLRLMHEMNGNWYPWCGTANGNSPQEFIVAWRHVHDIFVAEGVTNVTWVWSVNHESVPSGPANAYWVYYPGDSYVDWVSISGFNWGTSTPGNKWEPLDFWYAQPLTYLESTGKPIVVSEFGSVEQGGDKSAWITDAYFRFRTEYPGVKAVVYYDKIERQRGYVQDWRIATSLASLEAFRAAVAQPYILPGPCTTLSDWTSTLTPQNWVYLRSLKPVY